jgi:hypothetical protein
VTPTSSRAPTLADLDPAVRADVLAAVRAVEEAEQPVPRAEFRALADATLRAAVERVLRDSGRVLMKTPRGFLTGYADDIREALAVDGIGVLPPEDRAVLCLVMLHAVVIPAPRGSSRGRRRGPSPRPSIPGRCPSRGCPTTRSGRPSAGYETPASWPTETIAGSCRARSSRG